MPQPLGKLVRVVAAVSLLGANFVAHAADKSAVVTSVRVVEENGAGALEIMIRGGGVITPLIQKFNSPARLVIDLPNSRLGFSERQIISAQQDILAGRIDQSQQSPPSIEIILMLKSSYDYAWDKTGQRLMVRLKPPEETHRSAAIEPAMAPGLSLKGAPAMVPVTGGSGVAVDAGKLGGASSITAGSETAVLSAHHGEVRVCPGTTISVTPSRNNHELMLGISTGGIETHYALDASADAVLTPDFRIMFAGPGQFDYAVSVDTHGNTCVRGLKGNTSSAIVSELMGDRIYQVKPDESVVFRSGQIDKVDTNVPPECGCPAPTASLKANAAPAKSVPESRLPTKMQIGGSAGPAGSTGATPQSSGNAVSAIPAPSSIATSSAPTRLSSGPETAPLPASQPNDMHVQVDVPMVFTPKDRAAMTQPVPVEAAKELPVEDASMSPVHLDPSIQLAMPDAQSKPRQGFFHRVGGFFSSIFHH